MNWPVLSVNPANPSFLTHYTLRLKTKNPPIPGGFLFIVYGLTFRAIAERFYNSRDLTRNFKRETINYFLIISAIFLPISAGLLTTWIPHSLMIFILAAAVSSAPPTMAP